MSKGKFSIVGESFGGCIAGIFACQYPDNLLSIGLFCPSGIRHEHLEKIIQEFVASGVSILLPKTIGDMELARKMLTHKEIPLVPKFLQSGFLRLKLEKEETFRKCKSFIFPIKFFNANSFYKHHKAHNCPIYKNYLRGSILLKVVWIFYTATVSSYETFLKENLLHENLKITYKNINNVYFNL